MKKQSAASFVRKHPGKPTKEVMALGKKAGIKVSLATVYATRSYDKQKSKPHKTGVTEFIRKHQGQPAKIVKALAKKAGFNLSEATVYKVRSRDKTKPTAALARTPSRTKLNSSEHAWIWTTLEEVGLKRARQILDHFANLVAR